MILEAICNGNFLPVEQICPNDPAYRQETEAVCDILEQLAATLPPEEYARIKELLSHNGLAQCIENEAYFSFGFSAGMMLEREIQGQLRHWEKTGE